MENKRYRPTALEWLWHSGAGSYKVAADHQLATGSQHCRSSSTSIQNPFHFLEAVNYVRYLCTSLFRSKSFQWATFVTKCTSQSSSFLSWWWGNNWTDVRICFGSDLPQSWRLYCFLVWSPTDGVFDRRWFTRPQVCRSPLKRMLKQPSLRWWSNNNC